LKSYQKKADPFLIADAFLKMSDGWILHWPEFINRSEEFIQSLQQMWAEELERFPADILTEKAAGDPEKSFVDAVKWQSQTARKYHALAGRWMRELAENAPGMETEDRRRALFWLNQMISAAAPLNYFWTNAAAVQRCLKTQGESLASGYRNWGEDVRRGDHMVSMVDDAAFKVGENLAVTPGQVVFRNELMELIQYEPATETTFASPIVLVQPWINKYYIFDLTPGNSFVRYLVGQGFTVFITSWKNPSKDMRGTTFDDYVFKGVLEAVNAAREICGGSLVHAAGYCIGGTAVAALMAWLNHEDGKGEHLPISDATLFAAMTDFSDPGDLGLFMTESAIELMETLMKNDGFLDSRYMGFTFRLLNPDGLIWRNVVNNYLNGQMSPKSDMLYWNSDSTRLPEAMASFYLRNFYLYNRMAWRNGLTLGGRIIDLRRVIQPFYIVGGMQDHISPWKGTFYTCNLIRGPVRYVLTSEGHITGIVNPPSALSKKKYWAASAGKDDRPDEWLPLQEPRQGTWWSDWTAWLAAQSPHQGKPPQMGHEIYPPLEAAPGRYVLEK
jgi:polyhydroxyalkanoate synthase